MPISKEINFHKEIKKKKLQNTTENAALLVNVKYLVI